MTIKSFGQAFSKACGVKGQSPLWDFKGRSPLIHKNSKQNLPKQILTIITCVLTAQLEIFYKNIAVKFTVPIVILCNEW